MQILLRVHPEVLALRWRIRTTFSAGAKAVRSTQPSSGARTLEGVTDSGRRFHRPSLRTDLTALLDEMQTGEPFHRSELAAATAAAVIDAGRGSAESSPERFVTLADQIGLDTLTELWRSADQGTLAHSLWAVYLLRTWCRSDAEQVARLWKAGRGYAPADEVVAGVSDEADPRAVEALADAVLDGAYRGDLAVALERAASFFRVVAAGRRELAGDGERGLVARELAARNDLAADGLAIAARRWRAGTLS